MATIFPFRAIRPNLRYADQLVFTSLQTESVAGNDHLEGSLPPLKTLLETGARLRPETPDGQVTAYRMIRNTVQDLLDAYRLWQEKIPGIYIYETEHNGDTQTGVWALTSLDDYRNGTIKIHELTFDDSVRRIQNYREHTGIEGSPVLLTYPPDERINGIIRSVKASRQPIKLGNSHGTHRIWRITEAGIIKGLMEAFLTIKTVYLADGHHRLNSAYGLAAEQDKKGMPVFDEISSLYMATDQLRIREFDRIVLPELPVSKSELIRRLSPHFMMSPSRSNAPVRPRQPHRMGLFHNGKWFSLTARTPTYEAKDVAASLDAAILQELVLKPVFGISDPATDHRLRCIGGEKAVEEMEELFASHPGAIAFTLCPLTAEHLMAVADAEKVLPQKSTWIDPKVPYGLLLHRHETI